MKHRTAQTSLLRSIPAPVYVVWGALLLLVAIGAVATAAEASPTQGRTCFAAADWGPAPDDIRPCVKLHPREGGGVAFVVSDAGGTIRYHGTASTPLRCTPNVAVRRVYEDGSFSFVAACNGRRVLGGVSNLDD